LGGFFGPAFIVVLGDDRTATVKRLASEDSEASPGRTVTIDSLKYDPTRYIAEVSLDGENRSIQVSSFMEGKSFTLPMIVSLISNIKFRTL
jgi:hypothetical protein